MITVVSPRWMLLDVVVIVLVTLQLVSVQMAATAAKKIIFLINIIFLRLRWSLRDVKELKWFSLRENVK